MPGEQNYLFECQLPAGPLSYSGRSMKIVWEVNAQLDAAWRLDAKASRRFILALP